MIHRSVAGTARSPWFKGSAAIAFLATATAGLAIGVGAFLAARYGPAGSNWSFRGNGALAVYAAVPAVVAAGWTAVARRYRGRAWVTWSLAAGFAGLVLAGLDAALLPIFGTGADRTLGPVLLLALAAWTPAAPALALTIRRGRPAGAPLSAATAAAAALGVVIGLMAGLALTTIGIPPGS